MVLEIYGEDATLEFCEWLADMISQQLRGSIDERKLLPWNDYLSSGKSIELVGRKSILAKEIIFKGASLLRVRKLPKKFIIEINPNIMMPGVKMKKVVTLCKLINYGNQDIKGYPIFSNILTMVAENIGAYIDLYAIQNNRRDIYGS